MHSQNLTLTAELLRLDPDTHNRTLLVRVPGKTQEGTAGQSGIVVKRESACHQIQMRGCLRRIVRKLTGSCVGQILVLIASSLFWLWILSVIAEWRWGVRNEKAVTIVRKIEPTLETEILADKENVKKVLEERVKIMKDACKKHGLDTLGSDPLHQVNPWEYFINYEHSLVWCNVFKSASTSWMYIFNVLSGYTPKFLEKTRKVPLTLAREKYPRPSVDQLQKVLNLPNATSVIIARYFAKIQ